MIATYHSLAFHHQLQSTPWSADELFEFDLPESTGECDKSVQLDGDVMLGQDRDQILNHLRHLTISSLSSYQEIAAASTDPHLKSFAEVIVRQRTAQQQSLFEIIGYLGSNEEDESVESVAALRSLWRGAIWNLQEGHRGLFLEYAERAEALLEESYLLAARILATDAFAAEIRNYAVMICGARAVLEELTDHRPQEHGFVNGHVTTDLLEQPVIPHAPLGNPKRFVARAKVPVPKRRTKPLARREGNRREWNSDPAPRSVTAKSNRSASRSTKVERF